MNNCCSKFLPSINLSFKRISTPMQNLIVLNAQKSDFLNLIPDRISKQVIRLKRQNDEANIALVEMKDGSSVKVTSLLELSGLKGSAVKEKKFPSSKKEYIYRKLRLSSSIYDELISFFSSSLCPGILRFDKGFWTISQVNTHFLLILINF